MDGTALQAAVLRGERRIMERLLQARANVNLPGSVEGGKTALQAAIRAGQTDIVELLLKAVANVKARGSRGSGGTALFAAICGVLRGSERVSLVRRLLNSGADLNEGRPSPYYPYLLTTALCVAVEEEDLELVNFLLDAGAEGEPHAVEEGSRSPLQEAARVGTVEMVRLLLRWGAKVNFPPSRYLGRTALQAAIDRDVPGVAMIETLLEAGADINARAGLRAGLTCLQAAAIRGYLRIVQKLNEAGADVNAAPSRFQGRTALDGAAQHGRLDTVQLLLSAGADGKCCYNHQPFEAAIALARMEGHVAVTELLEAHRDAVAQGINWDAIAW